MSEEEQITTALVPTNVGQGALVSANPQQFVEKAAEFAAALASVIESQELYADIQGKKYVMVEGWTTLSAMLGITPMEVDLICIERSGFEVFVATVSLVNTEGRVIARASAECGSHGDGPWPDRADYAKRSMAITRATSKACRLAFSWVMTLAGYAATPAEEVPEGGFSADPPSRQSPKGAASRKAPAGRAAASKGGNRTNNIECPSCGVVGAIIKGKEQYGGGYLCWKKAKPNPGCNSKWATLDELTGASTAQMGGDAIDVEPIDLNAIAEGTVVTKDQGVSALPEPIDPPKGLFE